MEDIKGFKAYNKLPKEQQEAITFAFNNIVKCCLNAHRVGELISQNYEIEYNKKEKREKTTSAIKYGDLMIKYVCECFGLYWKFVCIAYGDLITSDREVCAFYWAIMDYYNLYGKNKGGNNE